VHRPRFDAREAPRFVAFSILVIAAGFTARAIGGAPPELLHSATKQGALAQGVAYEASLFEPAVHVTATAAGWRGAQWVDNGYDWMLLVWRDRGGIAAVSAPRSIQSAAATLHVLETERAAGPSVGFELEPAVALTIGGFPGQQFDGFVSGKYGHTFVPFSGRSKGASGSAGDHFRVPDGKAFRIVVLNVRAKTIVFELDSDSATLDPAFLAAATKMLKSLAFVQ
jgi:hypothetical protein